MKTSPSSRRGRASREADRLVELAEGLADSGSRAEDRFWERRLEEEVETLLRESDEGSLNAALDRLADRESRAYEELADVIESQVEHAILPPAAETDAPREVLLFAAPVLAWSRRPVPTRRIGDEVLTGLSQQLLTHVFSSRSELVLADFLYSPDQLPESFGDTAELRTQLSARLGTLGLPVNPADIKDAAQFLADQRYVLGVVSLPKDAPIFRWQEGLLSRDDVSAAWKKAAEPLMAQLLPACGLELMLPRAYYVACREADRSARPFSTAASVAYLSTTLAIPPTAIYAVVGGCYSRQLEEYRIGFGVVGQEEIVHGVVWPLLGAEDEDSDIIEEIEACLKLTGLQRVDILRERLPLEYCDDCGTPLYPNLDGELVHAELPEVEGSGAQHLH